MADVVHIDFIHTTHILYNILFLKVTKFFIKYSSYSRLYGIFDAARQTFQGNSIAPLQQNASGNVQLQFLGQHSHMCLCCCVDYVSGLNRTLQTYTHTHIQTHTQTDHELNPTPGCRYDPGGWANSHHTREISWCCMWCLVTRKQSQPCQSLRPETFCMQVYKYTANTLSHCTIEHESRNTAAVTNLVGVTLLL